MRKYLKFFIYFTLAMVGMFTACSDDDDASVQAISYALPEHMHVNVEDGKPVIIKSEEEFNSLFSDYKEELKKVDFDQYDLVYAQGSSNKAFLRPWIDMSSYPYVIYVFDKKYYDGDVYTGLGAYLEQEKRWAVAFLLPKSDNNQVTLFDPYIYIDD